MKQRVRRWKAMMMAVMLVLSIILPAKTVRAADSVTTIQVTGIEEGVMFMHMQLQLMQ